MDGCGDAVRRSTAQIAVGDDQCQGCDEERRGIEPVSVGAAGAGRVCAIESRTLLNPCMLPLIRSQWPGAK